MAKQTPMESEPVQVLRSVALRYPETEEGVVCMRSSFAARGKAFLFIGTKETGFDVMLKLAASLPEAAHLAAQAPDCYKVGAHGWVTATFEMGRVAPAGLLERWIDESFRLLAHKQLVALLAERGGSSANPAKKARKAKTTGRDSRR